MHTSNHILFLASLLAGLGGVTSARDVPANVKSFHDQLAAQGACKNKLADGFFSSDDGPGDFAYCGDHLQDFNVIYIKGSGADFANTDIDCDGVQNGPPVDDKRCFSSEDTQAVTSFQDVVAGYNKGITDLNAKIHPYVVFGNSGEKPGWKTFDPTQHGVEPLSVMAVVCGDKLIYGVWGDTNGDDGAKPVVGETSLSLATACFGQGVNGNSGHDENDVLYIAFPGADAVPGPDGAKWNAASFEEFEDSIAALGDKLIARIGGSSVPDKSSGGGGNGTVTTAGGVPAVTTGPVISEAAPGVRVRAPWGRKGRRAVKARKAL